MPSQLGEVIQQIQNPALGAFLQWRFAVGYTAKHSHGKGCPVLLLFLVLPILYHEVTYGHLRGTYEKSGLRTFAEKFGRPASNQADLLYALHDRVAAMQAVSLDAIQVSLSSRLIAIDVNDAIAIAVTTTPVTRGIPQPIQTMAKNAEKLGGWCAELSLHQISATLKVRF